MKKDFRVLAVALVGVVLVGMTGCYREVVSKKGLTVDAHHPRKARSSEPNIDRAIDRIFEGDDK